MIPQLPTGYCTSAG